MFEITPKICRETLLSHNSEETYMSYYVGVPIIKKLFKSTLRVDNHETCSFHKKYGKLKFHDFREGLDLDFIEVVMYKFNVDYYSAMNIIANDFGIIKIPDLKKNEGKKNFQNEILDNKPCKINVEIKPFSESELRFWGEFGISISILKKYHVYALKTVFLEDYPCYFSSEDSPIFGYYFGKKEGRELWKIYFPKKKKGRFLLNCSVIQGWKNIPETGEYIVITKALKDVMCLRELEIPAIAPQSENSMLKKEEMDKIQKRFKHVFIFMDNDSAGFLSMIKYRKLYPYIIPIWLPKNKSKDISDYRKKYGEEKTKKLINQFKQKYEEILNESKENKK